MFIAWRQKAIRGHTMPLVPVWTNRSLFLQFSEQAQIPIARSTNQVWSTVTGRNWCKSETEDIHLFWRCRQPRTFTISIELRKIRIHYSKCLSTSSWQEYECAWMKWGDENNFRFMGDFIPNVGSAFMLGARTWNLEVDSRGYKRPNGCDWAQTRFWWMAKLRPRWERAQMRCSHVWGIHVKHSLQCVRHPKVLAQGRIFVGSQNVGPSFWWETKIRSQGSTLAHLPWTHWSRTALHGHSTTILAFPLQSLLSPYQFHRRVHCLLTQDRMHRPRKTSNARSSAFVFLPLKNNLTMRDQQSLYVPGAFVMPEKSTQQKISAI